MSTITSRANSGEARNVTDLQRDEAAVLAAHLSKVGREMLERAQGQLSLKAQRDVQTDLSWQLQSIAEKRQTGRGRWQGQPRRASPVVAHERHEQRKGCNGDQDERVHFRERSQCDQTTRQTRATPRPLYIGKHKGWALSGAE